MFPDRKKIIPAEFGRQCCRDRDIQHSAGSQLPNWFVSCSRSSKMFLGNAVVPSVSFLLHRQTFATVHQHPETRTCFLNKHVTHLFSRTEVHSRNQSTHSREECCLTRNLSTFVCTHWQCWFCVSSALVVRSAILRFFSHGVLFVKFLCAPVSVCLNGP